MAAPSRLESVIALAQHRGFVFQAGEIYGGSRSAWDYGPLGVELKENIKKQWWRYMVTSRADVVGLDSSVILPKQVWVASGHVGVFTDPLVECLHCHKRFREDHLLEQFEEKKGRAPENGMLDIVCPNCGTRGQWTPPRDFNMMLRTYLGPVEDESGLHYLRPETAQGIFTNFANVLQASRMKPPFGIGQIGKSFRNEITPGNFIFRTREFEQMELEFFVEPGTDDEWFQYWLDYRWNWYVDLGIDPENLRLFEHPKDKLSHYSKRTVDIEYRFGFTGGEWGELEGVANRTDFDLTTHSEHSGKDLSYFDQSKNERWVPYVIEPAAGLTRSLMAFLVDAYDVEEVPNAKGGIDSRTVLKLDPRLAPVKAAVLPLSRNERLSPLAREVAASLRKHWNVDFDDAGAIGRRYRRQDEIGTPYCITVDFDSLDDNAVTVRDRDTMAQERVPLAELEGYLAAAAHRRVVGRTVTAIRSHVPRTESPGDIGAHAHICGRFAGATPPRCAGRAPASALRRAPPTHGAARRRPRCPATRRRCTPPRGASPRGASRVVRRAQRMPRSARPGRPPPGAGPGSRTRSRAPPPPPRGRIRGPGSRGAAPSRPRAGRAARSRRGP